MSFYKTMKNTLKTVAFLLNLSISIGSYSITMDKNPYSDFKFGNHNGIVGSIKGDFQVSPTGSLQYEMDLELPDGCGGFKPDLSISYDSRQGDGILGYGFSLSCISMINRVQSDYFHDGCIKDISLTSSDKLALDGNRMTLMSNGVYSLEINDTWKITADNKSNPSSFIVQKGDGTTWYYGSSANSRVSKSGVVLMWLLDKVVDSNGNYYIIEYTNNYIGQYWINTIRYTGNTNAGVEPQYTIKFNYRSRDKGAIHYIADSEFFTNLLLTSIEIQYGAQIIRRYNLSYKTNIDKIIPYLAAIKAIGKDQIGHPQTIFSWDNASNNELGEERTLGIPYTDWNDTKLYVADFNGDGRRDLLLVYPSSTLKKKIWSLYINKGNGSFKYGEYGSLDSNHQQLLIGDFNADGKYDFIEQSQPAKNKYNYCQYISDGTTFTKKDITTIRETRKATPIVSDFNGDCIDDLLLCYENSTEYKLTLYYPTISFNSTSSKTITGSNANKWSDIVTADFSGDGMSDIINLRKDGYDYLHAVCDTTFKQITTYAYLKNNGSKITGDFNGDGKIDIMHIDGSLCQIFTSTGTAFTCKTAPDCLNPTGRQFFVSDIDGDGSDDIYSISLSGGYQPIKIFINSNYGTAFKECSGAKVPPISDIKQLYTADLSGNGKADIVCIGHSQTSEIQWDFLSYYLQPSGYRPLVHKITDGFGNYHRVVYSSMNNADVHSLNHPFSYPLRPANLPVPVVSTVYSNNGIGGQNKETYTYENGSYHCKGRGFIGYRKILRHDSISDIKTVLSFKTYVPKYIPSLVSKEVYLHDKLIESYNSINRVYTIGSGTSRCATVNSIQNQYDYETQGITHVEKNEYTYNADGDVTRHIQVINGCDSIVKNTTYNNNYLPRITGRPASIVQQGYVNGTPATKIEELFSYSGPNLSQKTTKKGGKTQLIERFTYSPTGNVLSKKLTAGGLTRTESVAYDACYLHKTQYTDAGGYVSNYTYDANTGWLASEDCADGITKDFEYDGFGRMNYWEAASHACVNVLRWSDGMPTKPQNAAYFQYEHYWGKAPVLTYYDSLGRKLRTVSYVYGDKTVFQDWVYNSKDLLEKVSGAYFSTDSPVYLEYEYDDTGRKVAEHYPDGSIKTWNYESLGLEGEVITETNRLGQKTTRYNNFRGQTYKCVDNLGGAIEYGYDADGNCTSITGPNSSISMEFDEFGNRVYMNDSDCGSYSFEYDGFGQQTSQVHEDSGRGFTTEYDALGRITRREDSDGITDYVYSSDRLGLLESVSNEDTGVSMSYRYDNNNNPTQEALTVNGTTYRTYYTHDNKNNLTRIHYPNHFDVTNEYDDYGHLTSVKHPSQSVTYWQLMDADEQNRPLRYKLGNGIVVKREYDKNTGALTSLCDSTLFKYHYTYDFEGNLKSQRKDSIFLTSYQYDSLNRLIDYTQRVLLERPGGRPGDISPIFPRSTIIANTGNASDILLERSNKTFYDNAGNITKAGSIDTCMYADGSNRLLSITAKYTTKRPLEWNEIKYNSYQKVTRFVALGKSLDLKYGVNGERIMAEENDSLHTRNILYVSRLYHENTLDGVTSKNNYIYAGNMLVAVCQGNAYMQPRYYHHDRLGSVVGVSDTEGNLIEKYSYTPWGSRSCELNTADSISPERRGFTGHENINLLDLVNMNGRIYDPYTRRFITPDPFVQAPDNTQSLNRYAYCINNPLKYTDPSGEFFIIDDFFVGFFKGLFSGKNPLKTGYQHAVNSARIWWGLFTTDSNKSFLGRIFERFSRLTFQFSQTIAGFLYGHFQNTFHNVYSVHFKYGATVIPTSGMGTTATLGNYIIGNKALRAADDNSLFQHEYGHYIQSQRLGPAYWPVVAIPSAWNVKFGENHRYQSYEMNANYLSFMYFNKNVNDFYKTYDEYHQYEIHEAVNYFGWDFSRYPLIRSASYVDYYDTDRLNEIRKSTSLKINFWNYIVPFIPNF